MFRVKHETFGVIQKSDSIELASLTKSIMHEFRSSLSWWLSGNTLVWCLLQRWLQARIILFNCNWHFVSELGEFSESHLVKPQSGTSLRSSHVAHGVLLHLLGILLVTSVKIPLTVVFMWGTFTIVVWQKQYFISIINSQVIFRMCVVSTKCVLFELLEGSENLYKLFETKFRKNLRYFLCVLHLTRQKFSKFCNLPLPHTFLSSLVLQHLNIVNANVRIFSEFF